MKVITLVERGGKARLVNVETVTAREVRKVVLDNADTDSKLMTDQAIMYRRIGRKFAGHEGATAEKRNGFAAWLIPIPSRGSSAFSSPAWSVCISIAASGICIVTSPSS